MLEDGDDFSGWKPMQCSTCKCFELTGILSGDCHCEESVKIHVYMSDWCENYDDNR